MNSIDKKLKKYGYSMYLESVKGIYCEDIADIQLIYVVKGQIDYRVNSKDYQAEKGDFIVLNPGENKFLYSSQENIILVLNLDTGHMYEERHMNINFKFKNLIKKEEGEKDLLSNMIFLLQIFEEEGSLEEAEIRTEKILLNLIKNFKGSMSYIYEGENYKIFNEIKNIVRLEEMESLSLNHLSEKLHLSSSYISRNFIDITGEKFTDFSQQYKLYLASRHILSSNETIEEVGELVGFSSTKSLNRLFDKYLKITPSAYRKKYKELEDPRQDRDFKNLFNSYLVGDFSSFLSEYHQGNTVVIDTGEENPVELFKSWPIIRNLRSLGSDYNSMIDRLSRDGVIEEIILRFKILRESKKIYLIDIRKEISLDEFLNLLYKCIEHDIVPMISLYIDELRVAVDYADDVEDNLRIYRYFYETISESVGKTNMKRFKFSVDARNILDYVDNDRILERYKLYIGEQKKIIEAAVGSRDFNLGYELGETGARKIGDLEKLYNKLYVDDGFNISYISLSHMNSSLKMAKSLEELEKQNQAIRKFMGDLNILKGKTELPIERIYHRKAFRSMDIKDVDERYRDFFIVNLMLCGNFNFIGTDIRYITDYSVSDTASEKGYYFTPIIDQYKFYTPLYWVIKILDQLKGELIYFDEGMVVTRREEDLYALIYGNVWINYMYALNKGFIGLEEDRYEFDLKIKGLAGRYKIVTNTLSFERGSPRYYLPDLENYRYLNHSERKYIRRISTPGFNVKIEELSENYRDKISYSPYNIILKKYIKL